MYEEETALQFYKQIKRDERNVREVLGHLEDLYLLDESRKSLNS